MVRTSRNRTRDSILNRNSKFEQIKNTPQEDNVPDFANDKEFKSWLLGMSYKKPKEREEEIKKSKWSKHLKLSHFNNDEFFALNAGKNLFNVHRGSSNLEDFALTDVALAFNNLENTDRYKRSALWSQEATDQYGQGQRVIHVGHSLGGTLAEKISTEQGTESDAYNQGTSPFSEYGGIDRSKHRSTRIEGDAVSASDKSSQGVETLAPKWDGTVMGAFGGADRGMLGVHTGLNLGDMFLKLLHAHGTDRFAELQQDIPENKP